MPGKITCVCGQSYSWKPERAGKRAKCKCGAVVTFPAQDPDLEQELQDAKAFDQALRNLPPHETTPSGSPVYRHEPRTKPFEIATGDEATISAIAEHIALHIGPPENVFHEIVSDLVHIDVHLVPPTPERNWYTLVTSGMSDRPMTTPDDPDFADFQHAELIIALPPDWPLDQESFEDENNYWPIRWLKNLARLPHEYETWLGWGHTVPNGDPAEPFADNTGLCCALLLSPVLAKEGMEKLTLPDGRVIQFYTLVPIYREEMEYKLQHGGEALVDRLAEAGVTELLDPQRPNTCAS